MQYMTSEEQAIFWLKHDESRTKIDEDYAKLPTDEKLEILEMMRANHRAMREANPRYHEENYDSTTVYRTARKEK